MIIYKVKVGKGMLEFQGNNMKDVHKWADIWGSLPEKCSCNSDNIHLGYLKTQQGYEFLKLKCKSCGATFNINQNKEGEYYIKPDEKFEIYNKGSKEESPPNFDDIPY